MAEESAKRACGGCTMCCFTHAVKKDDEVLTNSFEWCKHCVVGTGCGIFREAHKPQACDEWECVWLDGELKEADRPDKTGIVMYWQYLRLGRTLMMVAARPGALETPYAQGITKQCAKRRIPIQHIRSEERKQFVFERGIVIESSLQRQAARENLEIVFIDTD